jgi:biotin carboxyl carrier protein
MKMEHVVTAPISGTVGRIMVHAGAAVALDQPLVTIEADPRPEP